MLKGFFVGVLIFYAVLHAQTWSEPLKINIDSVDKVRKIVRFQAYDLKVGESGYILAKLTDYSVIVANVEVFSIQDGVALGKYGPFNVMKQPHLPTPRMTPKQGNLAIFREFNNQAFLIAPDLHTYEKVKDSYPDTNFISSDLLMTFLNGFDPTVRVVRKACDIYSVGLLFVVSTNRLSILDCQSFAILESSPLDTSRVGRTYTPFFSRVEGIDRGTLGKLFAGGRATHYFAYYDALLRKQSEKKLVKDVKTEDKRELKKDIKDAKTSQEKKTLEKEYKEEIKEEKQSIMPGLSKKQEQEERSLDATSSKERAKEAKEAKKAYKKELAKERTEAKAKRKAEREARKKDKKKSKQIRKEEQE
ncbi:plasminogen-binding N-terminal domain-containing protein [Helicobacter suis]|uniref:plasminogen-binding N-terminal domain-containing protein n=1 Tax=Helicobacter suis TaxID=104628 RepID=UPI00196860DF|nr:plasminogen-binding N-terminal domain-containing protein [Helicobacter suis]